jgi:hypothetical protein
MTINDQYILTKPGVYAGRIWFWAVLWEDCHYHYRVQKFWGVVDGAVFHSSSVGRAQFNHLSKEVRSKLRSKGYVRPTDAELLQIRTHLEKHLMWQALAHDPKLSS